MLNQKEFLSEFSIPTYEDWKKAAEEALKGAPFEKKMFTKTYENIDLQPIYNINDREKVAYTAESMPGNFPFTRGVCSSGYKSKNWNVTQAFSYPIPAKLNEALKADLERGQNAIALSVCNCRTMFASEYEKNPEWDEIVCAGVHLNDMKDMEDTFQGIDLTKVTVNILPTCPVSYSLELAALFIAYCEKNNIDKSKLNINFGFDLTQYWARQGRLDNQIAKLFDDMAALVKLSNEISKDKLGRISAIAIDGCTYHNSGANALQEIAYSIATAVLYIKELINRGFKIDEIAPNIQFNFSSGVRFFTEISKLRAARIVWAKVIKSFEGNECSQKMKINAFTSKINKTKFDPYVNILRGTTEGLAAILAGANSLHIGTFDEELGMPSEFSRRIARNIQSILKEEAHILDTIDPAGGSYYIESLTNEFTTAIWNLFKEVEKNGGITDALKKEFVQNEIAKVVAKRKESIETRKDVLLGTNKYPNLIEKPVDNLTKISKEEVKKHIANVNSRKKAANFVEIWNLTWQERTAKLIEAFKNGAIISDIWQAKPTEVTEFKAIPVFRGAEMFENLRFAAENFKAKTGKAPKLYFENFGSLKQYKGRADFSTDFFAVAGFEIEMGKGFLNAEEAIKNIGNLTAPAIVICSTDEIYTEVVPAYVSELKKQKPAIKVILAGYPQEQIEEFKKAGVDEFIHIKSNVYKTLEKLMQDLKIV